MNFLQRHVIRTPSCTPARIALLDITTAAEANIHDKTLALQAIAAFANRLLMSLDDKDDVAVLADIYRGQVQFDACDVSTWSPEFVSSFNEHVPASLRKVTA